MPRVLLSHLGYASKRFDAVCDKKKVETVQKYIHLEKCMQSRIIAARFSAYYTSTSEKFNARTKTKNLTLNSA